MPERKKRFSLIEAITGLFSAVAILFLWQKTKEEKIFTYEDAIRYFATNRHPSGSSKGVITKRKTRSGSYVIDLCYLDDNDNLMTDEHGKQLGKSYRVRNLDNELLSTFKDHDVIIVA